jgi:hypothetical protein
MSEDRDVLTLDLTREADYTWSDEDADPPERITEAELADLTARHDDAEGEDA